MRFAPLTTSYRAGERPAHKDQAQGWGIQNAEGSYPGASQSKPIAEATSSSWYYVEKGNRIGPLSLEEIRGRVREGKVSKNTPVWRKGSIWSPAGETELAAMFDDITRDDPPPLAGKYVDNRFAWAMVAVPIIGSIIVIITARELMYYFVTAQVPIAF